MCLGRGSTCIILILESESKEGIPNLTSGQVTKIIFSGKSSGETRA